MAEILLPESMDYSDYVMAVATRNNGARKQIQKGPTTWSATPVGANGYWTFDIEGGQARYFLDCKTIYLDTLLTNLDAAAMNLPSCGGAGLIKKIVVESSTGTKISEINNYNNFVNTYDQATKGSSQLVSEGLLNGGTSSVSNLGEAIATTASRGLSIPIRFNVMQNHMYPLMGNVGLRIHIYFDNLTTVSQTDAGLALQSSDLSFSNPLLIYDVVQLEENEMEEILFQHDYKFDIVGSDFENQFGTMATADQAFTIQMGFSKRIAKRLYVTIRKDVYLSTVARYRNSFSRSRGNLDEIVLLYNGSKVNDQSLLVASTADLSCHRVYCENQKSMYNSLSSASDSIITPTTFKLNDAAEDGLTNGVVVGSFFACINLQNGLELENGETVSGANVQMGNFSIKFVRSSVGTLSQQVDLYLEYENKMSLNMSPDSGSGVWKIEN
jgi:hypothetical protein